MGHLNDLSAEIKTVLQAVQVSGAGAFVEVLERAGNQFNGYPSATIVPGETDSDYATVKQNDRTYVFMIYIYESLENLDDTGSSPDTAWENVRLIIDGVLDGLDNSDDLNNKADFVRPVPMQPFETEVGTSGVVLVAPIRVECVKSVDLV